MQKLKIKLFLFLLLFSATVFAQQRIVTGKIVSAQGEILAGATIKSSVETVASKENGDFSIKVKSAKEVLTISSVGYETLSVPVAADNNLSIKLTKTSGELAGVVVTALGIKRNTKSLTYAVQKVKTTELLEIRDVDVVNTLHGKVAGALISQGSGGLGSSMSINLRGKRGFGGSSSALFVVDGVPLNNFNYNAVGSDFGNGFTGADGTTTLNPDDIESMTILRGASASALYGSAASNGVILITTKKGKAGKMSVDVNSGITAQQVWQLPNLQNKYGQGIGGILDVSVGTSWGEEMKGQPYNDHLGETRLYSPQPNNVRDFYQTGILNNNSVGINYGSDKTQTYFSYSNQIGTGMIKLNEVEKHIFNFRISNQVSKRLSVDAKINFVSQVLNRTPVAGENNSPIFNNFQIPRSMPTDLVEDYRIFDDSKGVDAPQFWASTLKSIYQNPNWALNNINNTQKFDNLSGYIMAKYEVAKWLSVQGRGNYQALFNVNESRYNDGVLLYSSPGGDFSVANNKNVNQWFDLMLTGNSRINSSFAIDYQGGVIYSEAKGIGTGGNATSLLIPNKFSLSLGRAQTSYNNIYNTRTSSVFAQTNIAYKEKVFLDLSFRNDWNSTLPKGQWSYPYGSVGLSTVVNDLVKLPKAISFLKVSVSAARVGSGTGAYQLNTNYYANNLINLGVGYLTRDNTLPAKNLKPAQTTSYEGTVDVRLFNNKIGLEVTAYKTNSVNQIISVNLPIASGYSSERINAGNIENTGLEIVLNATDLISNSRVKWDASFNLTMNRNKVIFLSDNQKRSDPFIRMSGVALIEGKPTGEVMGYGWKRNAKDEYLVNGAGLPITTAEPIYLGNLNPKAIMGFTNNFSYKKFSLRLLVSARFGGVAVAGNEANLSFSGITAVTEQNRDGNWILDAVTESGAKNTQKINAEKFWTTVSGQRYGTGEFFAYDATNIRVREIALGYNFKLNSATIKSLRLSAFANNLFWIYRGSSLMNIPGLGKRKLPYDPDMSLGGSINGSDYGVFPSARQYGINLQMSF